MEQDSPLSPAVRLLLVLKAAVLTGLVTYGQGLRALDVALWTVLAGLAALGLITLAPLLRRPPAPRQREPADVVLPDRSAAAAFSAPDPAVQARAAVVDDARAAVLEARQRGAGMDELLALAAALHESTLDLARATLTAGGWVEPALRHELTLRDRAFVASADVEQPTTQG